MQGTVWGSLFCTATMDTLGKLEYGNKYLLNKYKHILNIQKCSINSVKTNAVINAFVESKKLTMSKTKCHRIHISRKRQVNDKECKNLKIHDDKMEDSDRE